MITGAPIVKMQRVPCGDGYYSIGATIVKKDEGEAYYVNVLKDGYISTETIECESLEDMLEQYDRAVEKYKNIV